MSEPPPDPFKEYLQERWKVKLTEQEMGDQK